MTGRAVIIAGVTAALASGSTHVSPWALLNTQVLIVQLVLFFLAGFITARSQDLPVYRSAAQAGLVAGLVFGLVEFATTLAIDYVFISVPGVDFGLVSASAGPVFWGAL